MAGIEVIKHYNEVLAYVVRHDMDIGKGEFFTPVDHPLQMGIGVKKTGEYFTPHVHKPIERKIYVTQEFVTILEGKLRVMFFDDNQNMIAESILKKGDAILFVSSRHGAEVLEDCKILEDKTGSIFRRKGRQNKVHAHEEILVG